MNEHPSGWPRHVIERVAVQEGIAADIRRLRNLRDDLRRVAYSLDRRFDDLAGRIDETGTHFKQD